MGIFMAAAMVELDWRRGTIWVWNGGLPPVHVVGLLAKPFDMHELHDFVDAMLAL